MQTHGVDLLPALETIYGRVPEGATLTRLRGDASTRVYWRLHAPGASPETAIVMQLPADALRSDEGQGKNAPPAELPFLNVHRLYEARGVPVPILHAADVPRRVVVLEDLGDETFEARLHARGRGAWPELYGAAVDLLAEMHTRCDAPDPGCIAYGRAFDETLLRWELDHFREWGLEALHGPLAPDLRAELDAHFDAVARELAALPRGFVHRDYQSRNLMWAPRTPSGTLVIIDFQDALLGTRAYDLVALLCDSYVALDEDLQRAMIRRYVSKRELPAPESADFERVFWLQALQRKLKDAGRFIYIDRVRKNPDFLPWYAPSLAYVARALTHLPHLAPLAKVLARVVPELASR